MSLLMIITLSSIGVIFWQIATIKLKPVIKLILAFLMCFGIAYLPIGITYKFVTSLPYWVIVVFGLLTATSIIFISLGFLRFAILPLSFVIDLIFNKNKKITKAILIGSNLGLYSLYVSSILGGFSFYQAAKVPSVKYYEFEYKNLPKELSGYKIGFIADTHLGGLFNRAWSKKVVNILMAQKPDIIAYGGDIGDGKPDEVFNAFEPFLSLSAPDGVFYVMGNHENYHSITQWRDFHAKHGLNVLEDEYNIHKSLPLVISGAAAGPRTKPTDYIKLLKNAPKDFFVLHLDHFPNRASKSKDYVDLQLSGHTHGGTTFYMAPLVAKFNEGFVNGLYNLGEMKLFVTSSAGIWSIAPLRLFVPSEIAIITLKKASI